MNETKQMPNGWVVERLERICFTTSGGTPSRKVPTYYEGHIPWVKSGELDKGLITKTEETISEEAVKNSSAKIFPKGTLLIALYGATIGKLGFLGIDAATNQAVCAIFKNEIIDLQLLKYYLFHKRSRLIEQGAGGAQPNISQTILKNLEVAIPPLSEQHRIVAQIETLFSSLDKGIESLKTAQAQLKTYRQAVLKWAFEGRFTNTNTKEGALPEGWVWKKLKEVANITSSKRIFQHEYVNKGIPFYRTKEIKELSEGRKPTFELFISIEKYNDIKQRHPVPKSGEVLLSAVGTIGISYVIKGDKPFYFRDGNLMWLKELNGINSYFLSYGLTSFIRYRNGAKRSGSAYDALTIETMKDFNFPIPSEFEQIEIVSEIERRLSVCDTIEESIRAALQQAEVLRQSILKRAFEGKLVAQDPNDEPAAVLLERIKQEREKNAPTKTNKKTSPSQTSYKNSKQTND